MMDWYQQRALAKEKEPEICRLYLAGNSMIQVAAMVGLSLTPVKNAINRNNLPKRTRAEFIAMTWTRERRESHGKILSSRPGPTRKGIKFSKPIFKPTLRGSGNPQWKGGRVTLQLTIRKSGAYSFWRRSIFERDGFACVECSARGKLEADHIHPFAKILNEHGITTLEQALACAALWDLQNGRTLCPPCHKLTPTFGCNVRRGESPGAA